jgi:hypothetical protein
MLLSSTNKYIHATMGSVQLSIASLGPLMLQNQKYVDNFMEMIIPVTGLLGKYVLYVKNHPSCVMTYYCKINGRNHFLEIELCLKDLKLLI